ncbi:TPA: hypothetical protein ACGOZ6_000865 [Streptococcus suis]
MDYFGYTDTFRFFGGKNVKKYCVGDIVLVKGRITEIDDSDEILDIAIAISENGVEDLKKARQNLDWLIESLEKNNG